MRRTGNLEKAKMNALEIFSLMVIFNCGTSLVVPLGMNAKQDAWMAILLGSICGCLLFLVYAYLLRQYPQTLLIGCIQRIAGKYLGWPIGLFYVAFFVYGGSRDLRDVGSLLIASGYDRTPLFVLNALIIASIAYVINKGIEVTARTGQILLAFLIVLGILGIILVFFAGIVDLDRLQPVLGKGWKPVLSTVFTQTAMFPFGELICFTMILPYLNKLKLTLRTGLAAIAFSGILLCAVISLEITVLGVEITAGSTFPLLPAIGKVEIGKFLQRVDAIVVFTLIVTDFMKVAIFYYAAAVGMAELFNLRKYQSIVLPLGILILWSSLAVAQNFPEHLQEGKRVLVTMFPLFCVGIPLMLLVVVWIRKRLTASI